MLLTLALTYLELSMLCAPFPWPVHCTILVHFSVMSGAARVALGVPPVSTLFNSSALMRLGD